MSPSNAIIRAEANVRRRTAEFEVAADHLEAKVNQSLGFLRRVRENSKRVVLPGVLVILLGSAFVILRRRRSTP